MPLPPKETRTPEQRQAHNEKMKRYYEKHPEQRQKCIERIMSRYYSDESYRELVKARARERRLRLKASECRDISVLLSA